MKSKETGFFAEAINDMHTEIYENLERLFGRHSFLKFISTNDGDMVTFIRGEDEVSFLKQSEQPREIMILVQKPNKEVISQAVIFIKNHYQKELEIIEWQENFDFDPATTSKELLEWLKKVEAFDS